MNENINIKLDRFEQLIRLEKSVDTVLTMLENKLYVGEEEVLEIIGTERAWEVLRARKRSRESMTSALEFAQRFESVEESEECKVD